MNAKNILEQKFDKGFNGYKMEEVDEFLREVSAEFSELAAQNENLEKKLEVLADKIREYRNDEDAIKEALLDARKESARIVSAADEKSKAMIAEAEEKAAALLKAADDDVAARKAEGERITFEANAEKERIIAECNTKSAEITDRMEREIKKYEAIIARTRQESEDFNNSLLTAYKLHIETIKAIPEKCENDYVKQVVEPEIPAPVFAEPVVQEAAPVEETVAAEEEKETDLSDIQAVFANPQTEEAAVEAEREADLGKTSEMPFQPVFEEEDTGNEEIDLDDDSSPFFNKKNKRRAKAEKLDFGGNNQ